MLDSAIDHTFITSAQSVDQNELLANHPANQPVFVEGGFVTWLRYKSLMYFILRSDRTKRWQEWKDAEVMQRQEEAENEEDEDGKQSSPK